MGRAGKDLGPPLAASLEKAREEAMVRPELRADPIGRLEEAIIAVLFAAMVLITFSQVIARYVFNAGAIWAVELTTYCFAWLVLFGASWGVKRSAHLGVDAFVKLFPKRWQRLFGLAGVVAALIYAGIMLRGSWDYVSKLYRLGIEAEDLPIPQWLPMSILVIGMGLLIVRLLQVALRILSGSQTLLLADEVGTPVKALVAEEERGRTEAERASWRR
jgi:C4-dicarboxylate transporter DctQ subunit